MSNQVLPMPEMFPACHEVFTTTFRPWHYKDLVEQALRNLKIDPKEINFKRQCEDVREKMLQARWKGLVFYLGAPYCLGAKAEWFQPTFNLNILTGQPIVIPIDMRAAEAAIFNALMRHMVKKNPNASDITVNKARARGLGIEEGTKQWFQDCWPSLFLPADNAYNYNQPCKHDFKLKINGSTVKVDISGPDRYGNYGNQANKQTTDLHLICDYTGDKKAIEWLAVTRGENYTKNLIPELRTSPLQMIVWLNCIARGLPYDLLKQASYGFKTNGRR